MFIKMRASRSSRSDTYDFANMFNYIMLDQQNIKHGKPLVILDEIPLIKEPVVAIKPPVIVIDDQIDDAISNFGITNIGNSCYTNASLQALLSLTEFRKLVNVLGRSSLVSNALHKMMHGSTQDTCVKELRNGMDNYMVERTTNQMVLKMFTGFGQEDAQEFIGRLMEKLEVDALGVSLQTHHKFMRSFFSSVTVWASCTSCGTPTSAVTENQNVFQLALVDNPLGMTTSIDDLLEYMTEPDAKYDRTCDYEDGYYLDGEGVWQRKLYKFITHNRIVMTSPVVCIQIMRFDEHGTKIDDLVTFNEQLDLGPYMMKPHENKYQLTAVVYHHGNTMDSGHYTSICRRNGKLYDFNDNVVTPVIKFEIPDAYILFYEQVK